MEFYLFWKMPKCTSSEEDKWKRIVVVVVIVVVITVGPFLQPNMSFLNSS